MSTNTVQTTDAEGKVTTVVHQYEKDVHDKWAALTLHINNLETAARASGWAGIAYAAFQFARHMI
jgi:hypothetical protein